MLASIEYFHNYLTLRINLISESKARVLAKYGVQMTTWQRG